MCYKAGPRCPSVALLAIQKAESKWQNAQNVSERNDAMGEIMEAKHQYDLTIQGQKQIESTIETAKLQGDTEEASRLQDRLSQVRAERQALLAKQGIKETKRDAKHSYEIPTAKEKPSERTKRLLDMVKVETASLSTSEGWQGHLDTAVNFPHLAFNNQILVHAQDPEATSLNTYEDWAKSGRAVRRNMQGVYLLTPTVATKKETNPATGQTRPVERITGFRSIATFDVQSTVGKKPEPQPVDLNVYNGHLTDKIEKYGYTVEEVDPRRLNGEYATTSIAEKKVYVGKGLSPDKQTLGLIGQVAHIGLGHDKNPASNRNAVLTQNVESHGLAYVLTKKAGLEPVTNFQGFEEWSAKNNAAEYAQRVSKAAKFLLS